MTEKSIKLHADGRFFCFFLRHLFSVAESLTFPKGPSEIFWILNGKMGSPAMTSCTRAGLFIVGRCCGDVVLLGGISDSAQDTLPLFQALSPATELPDCRSLGQNPCQDVLRPTGLWKPL